MINDLPNYFGKLGIELPEVLCDGKYEKVKNDIKNVIYVKKEVNELCTAKI